METTYASRLYQPGSGAACYTVSEQRLELRNRIFEQLAAEVRRHDWQRLYSNSLALGDLKDPEYSSPHAEKVIERAQAVADARAACRREFPEYYPGPVGPDGDGDAVIVAVLEFGHAVPGHLAELVKRLAETGRSNAVALVLVHAAPYAWPFPCEPLGQPA